MTSIIKRWFLTYFTVGDKVMDVPTEPSQKILWSIRRSYDSILMAQHRVSLRAQHVLHDLGLNGLLTVGYLIDLFQWVSENLFTLFI